jgi:hypothetical protein
LTGPAWRNGHANATVSKHEFDRLLGSPLGTVAQPAPIRRGQSGS